MKTERLITIVMMLLAQDTIAASRFAALFHVSKRTIMRDMDTLSAAHIPVVATRGAGGGFRLLPSYKFDKRLLTVADLQNILAAVQGLDALIVDQNIAATLTKVSGMLPATETGALTLDFANAQSLTAVVQQLRGAISAHQQVCFDYYDRDGHASSRVVEPYRLLWRNVSWYLIAYSTERAAYRTFRVSRLTNLQAGAPFSPRKNVPQGWSNEPRGETVAVRLHGSQASRGWLVEHFGEGALTHSAADGFDATVTVGQNADTFRFFAQCGTALQVRAPEAFRTAYRDYLQAMVDAQ